MGIMGLMRLHRMNIERMSHKKARHEACYKRCRLGNDGIRLDGKWIKELNQPRDVGTTRSSEDEGHTGQTAELLGTSGTVILGRVQ